MESLFGRYKNAIVLMLVLLAQVVLLAMQVRRPAPGMPDGHNVRLWRYLVTSVVTPPEKLVHSIGKSIRGVWSNYIYLHDLRQQNLNLQQENNRLRLEQASLAQDAQAGQRLRELLDFRGRYIDKTVAAQVVGTSGTDEARDIFIDKGSKDGLEVQMPVITPDGIVGKIKNVYPHSAQVLLISDQTSGTGVLLESTRVRGVMKGDASGQPQMVNISPDERIKPGEPVITSGGDEVYPPGMPVGVVDRVVPDPDSSYVNVVVKPNSDLGALEEVLVVVQFSDKMPFAQAKDINQSEAVALAAKQRAADILSEKLPSLRDPNAPEATPGTNAETSSTTGSDGDPARPVRPPQPLHPDRYTPGAAPAATELTPGAAPPVTHRMPATAASAPATTSGAKPGATTPGSTYVAGDAPASRFPSKPGAATSTPTISSTAAGAAGSGATAASTTTASGQPRTLNSSGTSTASATGQPRPSNSATASTTAGTGQPRPLGSAAGSTAAGQPRASNPATASTAAGSAQPRSSNPAANSVNSPSGQPRPASSGSPAGSTASPAATAAAPPVRRAPSSQESESDGILTPAGMGSLGTAARPRATAPAGTATTPGTSGVSSSPSGAATPKPAAPKPQTPKPQSPSGGRTSPPPAQSSPQPAAAPPGGA